MGPGGTLSSDFIEEDTQHRNGMMVAEQESEHAVM